MTVHISMAAAKKACDAINALIEVDAAAGVGGSLNIYAGTRPATADTAATGATLLISFPLPSPVFQPSTAVGNNAQASLVAGGVPPTTAAATGTASYFQIKDHDGLVILDGSVTDTAGTGDLKLSTVSVVAGIDVSVVSLTASMPTGA